MWVKNYFRTVGMFLNATPKIFANAKVLRENMTAGEMALWLHLRKGINGYKFRRQHPIGKYIVDFYCHKCKLVVEIDGYVHNDPENKILDKDREEDLKAWDCQILRFRNKQIFDSIEYVLEQISLAIRARQKL
jgi:cyclase